jgi:hypothetical protein
MTFEAISNQVLALPYSERKIFAEALLLSLEPNAQFKTPGDLWAEAKQLVESFPGNAEEHSR